MKVTDLLLATSLAAVVNGAPQSQSYRGGEKKYQLNAKQKKARAASKAAKKARKKQRRK